MTQRIFVASLLLAFSLPCVLCPGQFRNPSLPSPAYYSGFIPFYSADYGDALKQFERGANSALKLGPDARFMDSACYWTMAGECYYHMGNFPEAIGYYEQALELLLTHARGDWAQRIGPQPNQIQVSNSAVQRAAVNWHRSTRGSAIANVPNSFPVFFGRLDPAAALFEGGVVENPEIRPVDHREIMRCIALAVYRRGQIKGTTNNIDPFTNNLLSGLAKLPDETPVIGTWNLMVKGLADMSIGKYEQAVSKIKAGLQLGGGMDHDLTPIGLLALSRIALIQGEDEVAIGLALEASFSGAVFGQYDVVEESLDLATQIHLANNRTVPEQLVPAINWADRNRARKLQTGLLVGLADCQLEAGDTESAANTLNQARRSLARTDLARSVHAAKIRYLSSVLQYMEFNDGSDDLRKALELYAPHSLWRYQLALTNNALASGGITQRQTELVYEQLLVDPDENQWKYRPIEAMTYLTTPHVASLEQWFEILLARRNHEKAIEIAERIRRHRFYTSLPMSGRLLALRWICTAPDNLLSKNAKLQRDAIDAVYPNLRPSVNRIEAIERELRAMPLKPDDDSPDVRKQLDLFVEQQKHSRYQESVFAALALKRQPADFVFPAAVDYSRLSKALNPRQAVFSSLKTGSGYHQYVITQQTRRYLGVVRERDMRRGVANLYKALGITDANNALEASFLQGKEWQAKAAELKTLVFETFSDDQWESYDELVVVPDGVLWYVPFEILQTGDQADWQNLHQSVRIRYLPMISLTSGSRPKNDPRTRTAVIVGKLHDKAEPEISEEAFEELADVVTNATRFTRQFKIPSNLFGCVVDALLVWSDIRYEARDSVYSLEPFQLDHGRDGSTLAAWLNVPWRGPQTIVIPGFSSAAAAGLKSRSTGDEMFLLSCGFLASGARSILISRWRAGGQSSLDLSRDFLIRSQNQAAVDAWFDACAAVRQTELDFDREIRIKQSPRNKVDSLLAEHPFFWAANMLIDLESSGLAKMQGGAQQELADTAEPAATESTEVETAAPPDSAKADNDGTTEQSTSSKHPSAETTNSGSDQQDKTSDGSGAGRQEPAAREPA